MSSQMSLRTAPSTLSGLHLSRAIQAQHADIFSNKSWIPEESEKRYEREGGVPDVYSQYRSRAGITPISSVLPFLQDLIILMFPGEGLYYSYIHSFRYIGRLKKKKWIEILWDDHDNSASEASCLSARLLFSPLFLLCSPSLHVCSPSLAHFSSLSLHLAQIYTVIH